MNANSTARPDGASFLLLQTPPRPRRVFFVSSTRRTSAFRPRRVTKTDPKTDSDSLQPDTHFLKLACEVKHLGLNLSEHKDSRSLPALDRGILESLIHFLQRLVSSLRSYFSLCSIRTLSRSRQYRVLESQFLQLALSRMHPMLAILRESRLLSSRPSKMSCKTVQVSPLGSRLLFSSRKSTQ